MHKLDRSEIDIYDEQLSQQIEVILLEEVQFTSGMKNNDKSKLMGTREILWQHKLKAISLYGGLNEK